MDVKNAIVENMFTIVKQVYNRIDKNDNDFLEECFKLVVNDIDINLDSEKFYLLSYKIMDEHQIYFEYFKDANKDFLSCIKNLIRGQKRMTENIKNKHHKIHFRIFKDNVELEDYENTIRIEFFKNILLFVYDKKNVFKFLVNKLVHYENKVSTYTQKQADEEEEKNFYVEQLVIISRIKKLIIALNSIVITL